MKPPIPNIQPSIKDFLALRPSGEPPTKYPLPTASAIAWMCLSPSAIKDRLDLSWHRQFVQALILDPIRPKHDQATAPIDFAPTQATNFLSALTSKHKQPNDIGEVILA